MQGIHLKFLKEVRNESVGLQAVTPQRQQLSYSHCWRTASPQQNAVSTMFYRCSGKQCFWEIFNLYHNNLNQSTIFQLFPLSPTWHVSTWKQVLPFSNHDRPLATPLQRPFLDQGLNNCLRDIQIVEYCFITQPGFKFLHNLYLICLQCFFARRPLTAFTEHLYKVNSVL